MTSYEVYILLAQRNEMKRRFAVPIASFLNNIFHGKLDANGKCLLSVAAPKCSEVD